MRQRVRMDLLPGDAISVSGGPAFITKERKSGRRTVIVVSAPAETSIVKIMAAERESAAQEPASPPVLG